MLSVFDIQQRIFSPLSDLEFQEIALSLFHFQYQQNALYREYCDHLKVNTGDVIFIEQIPFLPISFFKTHRVVATDFEPEIVFHSSGTTGLTSSNHYVKELSLYEKSFTKGFEFFYGDPAQYTFLNLLPNYLEREGSSLIYMLEKLMSLSCHQESGFYLYDHQQLYETLNVLKEKGQKVILFGVSFALLDFIEKYRIDFPELIIFETGGMKGRRKEMVKEELHALLTQAFGVSSIHSEYGMCELLSQAYSSGDNLFFTPPWMRLILRDEKDPFMISNDLKSGIINVIDFANIYSCPFIATDDIGRKKGPGIEIMGRLDHAEIRGCSLLVV